jgi:hypothetical protein
MRLLVVFIATLVLLAVAAFCLVGFLATFEPTDRPGLFVAFRIGYAAIGAGCLAGIIALVLRGIRRWFSIAKFRIE